MALIRNGLVPVVGAMLSACSVAAPSKPFIAYLEHAPAGTLNSPVDDHRLAGFMALLGDFSRENIEARLDSVYAEELYFNDTFHTFQRRDDIKRYFLSLVDASQTEVRFLDAVAYGDDVLLRWSMTLKFKVWWKPIEVTSVGISHLRFDDNNFIVLQQDYWDSGGGFYYELPVIGPVLNKIRSGMGQAQ